jgi:hypothetical protein
MPLDPWRHWLCQDHVSILSMLYDLDNIYSSPRGAIKTGKHHDAGDHWTISLAYPWSALSASLIRPGPSLRGGGSRRGAGPAAEVARRASLVTARRPSVTVRSTRASLRGGSSAARLGVHETYFADPYRKATTRPAARCYCRSRHFGAVEARKLRGCKHCWPAPCRSRDQPHLRGREMQA